MSDDAPTGGSTISMLLRAAAAGDASAPGRLVPLIYDELRGMARARLNRERPGHSLQPTELVSEAYLRMADAKSGFENRRHFFGAAAIAMQRVLVDHARKRAAEKRGGGAQAVTFEELQVESEEPTVDLLALDEALTALETHEERLAQVVRLRFFAGFSVAETAEILGISTATTKRDWTYARAWLVERMG